MKIYRKIFTILVKIKNYKKALVLKHTEHVNG